MSYHQSRIEYLYLSDTDWEYFCEKIKTSCRFKFLLNDADYSSRKHRRIIVSGDYIEINTILPFKCEDLLFIK